MRNETVSLIVEGDSNVVGVPEDEGSFRLELGELLEAAGYTIAFLGQFDDAGGAHEGFNGKGYAWYVGAQQERILDDYAPNQPRVIVVWLGTNDQVQGSPVAYNAQAIIDAAAIMDQIHAADPKTWMVFCNVPPWAASGYPFDPIPWIDEFNDALVPLIATKQSAGQRVRLCDVFAVLDPGTGSDADLVDGVHLSESGRTKAATAIYSTIAAIFEGVGEGSIHMRALLNASSLDAAGNIDNGESATIYEVDGTTPLAATMYAASTGGTTVSNPLTSANGRFIAYVNVPQRAVAVVNGVSSPVEFEPDSGEANSALMTATGDQIVGGAPNTPTRVPKGTALQEWRMNVGGTLPEWATRPMVRVRRSTAQSIPDNTLTAVTFDTESYDTDGMHSTSSNTNRLTIVTPGKYAIKAQGAYAGNATGVRAAIIRINGTTTIAFDQRINAGASPVTAVLAEQEYAFIAGDYIEFIAYQDSGGALNLNSTSDYSPVLSATWVGP